MTNSIIFENKISSVRKYLKILDEYVEVTLNDIKKDLKIKGSLERYLYLMCQSTIDLSEIIVSYKKLRKPTSLSESFEILRENGYISDDQCTNLIKMTGFRNSLAHGYEKLKDDVLLEVVNEGRKDILEFLKIAEKLI